MKIQKPISTQPIPDHATKVFEGVMFDVYQWEQEMYDGTTATFEKLKRPDSVIIFPVLDDGKVLLTRQSQPGKDDFIGGAGGRVDPGEDILAAAKRELLEESGYIADEFVPWDAQQPVSKVEWSVYTFVAKGLEKVSEMNLDAGEKIELMPVTFDEFVELGASGKLIEKEVVPYLFEAKLDEQKMLELRKLFSQI